LPLKEDGRAFCPCGSAGVLLDAMDRLLSFERLREPDAHDGHSRAGPALDRIGGGNPALARCSLDPCLRRGDSK
jgi:hypothetical protein